VKKRSFVQDKSRQLIMQIEGCGSLSQNVDVMRITLFALRVVSTLFYGRVPFLG